MYIALVTLKFQSAVHKSKLLQEKWILILILILIPCSWPIVVVVCTFCSWIIISMLKCLAKQIVQCFKREFSLLKKINLQVILKNVVLCICYLLFIFVIYIYIYIYIYFFFFWGGGEGFMFILTIYSDVRQKDLLCLYSLLFSILQYQSSPF